MRKIRLHAALCSFGIACLLAGAAFTAFGQDETPLTRKDAIQKERNKAPIKLKTMGSLLFGGTVTKKSDGNTFHGDHGYAQYYIPQDARKYPMILWHGVGQSGRS